MTEKITIVICPTCGQNVAWIPTNRFRPFCSERCKMIDLGNWASEDYNLPADEDQPLSEEIKSSGS
ncbi:MAG: DNA gyrase inhibitor YacG [Snodgrassella sp.]|uniref:DNA gyrase inhibitor YacG n=1 Tax=Snodgrassella TaxID=1193515 RepID=UPI001EF47083|nr:MULTISPECIES: DNA gyrase inhibitor YacG [Snodgrassella]MCO6506339.1 DNA gyrase inhibitor YacG [Snodgrassella sp.]MCO6507842.1 DNA gyrase inhibitor YacG [Snodgrassella sp.]MCO6521957.1 DNA gyrase inhibitor YacG [Snodgrassella sp.]MCO6525644.1 DNA gyrase inhibitor YacG [Snodgrassella sp.]